MQFEHEIGEPCRCVMTDQIVESIRHDVALVHGGREHGMHQAVVFLHHLIELGLVHRDDQAVGQHDDLVETTTSVIVTHAIY